MKFLLDTNAIIPAEPTSSKGVEAETPNITRLIGLIATAKFQTYVHPASLGEIQGDRDAERREMRQHLFSKYVQLPSPPTLTDKMISVIGRPKPGSHDAVDMLMLAALIGNSVNFLVTNDNGIHRKAVLLDIAERVLTIADALVTVQGFLPKPVQTPPAVDFIYCHELRKEDPIFNSLREDYDGFDNWLEKIQIEHRKAFIIKDEEMSAAIAIIKDEETNQIGVEGPALKICTFKVADTGRGFRYGELLLRAIFDYVHTEGVPKAYVTCYSKQKGLMRFLKQFGFFEYGKQENKEFIFVKEFVPKDSDYTKLTPLDFHKQFGPYQIKASGANTFVVPIQPTYLKG
ncbi:MAG: hypothetical protein DCF25_18180 [Leptolyngbya foveolarum]|uniref:N-acetyltransferase domain-containing protein n=1 Tax=Leptolyngbya foveolarum TaxID=47253 RepID=A0A2W4VIV1_9CYAN|nr:MAG: hypothetical protein DCF25_18180 [Leptolyngbya foveolarum]